MMEEWRKVPNMQYEISSFGRLRRFGRVLKTRPDRGGYLRYALSSNGKTKHIFAHRLVCEAFIGPRPEGKEVNHKNGIRTDNSVENLEWVTRAENAQHKKTLGSFPALDRNGNAKLSCEEVGGIRAMLIHGAKQKEIAEIFTVSAQMVSEIARGNFWRGVAPCL